MFLPPVSHSLRSRAPPAADRRSAIHNPGSPLVRGLREEPLLAINTTAAARMMPCRLPLPTRAGSSRSSLLSLHSKPSPSPFPTGRPSNQRVTNLCRTSYLQPRAEGLPQDMDRDPGWGVGFLQRDYDCTAGPNDKTNQNPKSNPILNRNSG
eukprot:scaffold2090_cov225-Prasinococcus_capsulatus_cf.AAC.43